MNLHKTALEVRHDIRGVANIRSPSRSALAGDRLDGAVILKRAQSHDEQIGPPVGDRPYSRALES
jgi:hypothetical protein